MFFAKQSKQEIEQLKQEIAQLKKEQEADKSLIRELKEKLFQQDEKASYINEALVDARKLSQEIVDDAEKTAQALVTAQKEEMQESVDEFEKHMSYLNQLEKNIIAEEKRLKIELQEMIKRFSESIDAIDIQTFQSIYQGIDEQLTKAEDNIEQAKTIIQFPNLKATAEPKEETPVYVFTANN